MIARTVNQDRMDKLIDALASQPRGETVEYDGVSVYRSEHADPDGWEYAAGDAGQFLTDVEAAEYIISREVAR